MMRRFSRSKGDSTPRGNSRVREIDPLASNSRLKELELKELYDEKIEKPDGAADSTEHIKYYMRMRVNGSPSRDEYLKELQGDPKTRVEHEIGRIRKLRNDFFANPTKTELVRDHLKYQKLWRDEAIANREGNLQDLERRISNFNETRGSQSQLDDSEPVKDSQRRWTLLERVRRKPEVENEQSEHERPQHQEGLEKGNRDRRRKLIENEKRILEAILMWERNPVETSISPTQDAAIAKEKMNYNVKAGIMYFHSDDGEEKKRPHVEGRFPHQKIPIEILLSKEAMNPITEPSSHETGPMRYFHLPTNNMDWIEKFLELYYSKTSDGMGSKAQHKRLLAYQNWEGQIHGGTEHPVHARHMRPRCLSMQRDLENPSSMPGGRFKRRTSTLTPKHSE